MGKNHKREKVLHEGTHPKKQNIFRKFKTSAKNIAMLSAAAILVFVLSARNIDAKTPSKQKPDADIEKTSKKLSAKEIEQHAEIIWDSLRSQYPQTIWAWKMSRVDEGLEPEIKVGVVDSLKFAGIVDYKNYGKSCRMDDFFEIFVNEDRPFIAHELLVKICDAVCYYSYFKEEVPFEDLAVRNVAGRIMASSIYGKLPGGHIQAGEHEQCVFFFAALLGPQKFIEAYSKRDAGQLKQAYEQIFGFGAYNILLQSFNPMKTIYEHAKSAAISGEIFAKMKELAENCGYEIGPT